MHSSTASLIIVIKCCVLLKKEEKNPKYGKRLTTFFMHHNPQKPFHAKSSFCTRARFKSSHRCAQIGGSMVIRKFIWNVPYKRTHDSFACLPPKSRGKIIRKLAILSTCTKIPQKCCKCFLHSLQKLCFNPQYYGDNSSEMKA